MPTPRRNSRVQVLDAVSDSVVIPVVDLDRPDLNHLVIPATGAAPAAGSQTAVYPTGGTQVLNGTGALAAVDLTKYVTVVETTGAATTTLALPTVTGTVKRIRMELDTGDCVITVTSGGVGYVESLTLNDVGDTVDLIFDGTGWNVLDSQGVTVAVTV